MPRIFFATDLHGSETCWRKFLNAARYYNADVLICGGGMTGKAIIPLVEEDGGFELTLLVKGIDLRAIHHEIPVE